MASFTKRLPRLKSKSVQTQPQVFSSWSTPAVPNSAWCSNDLLLGAGMVVIQPSTGKIVLLYESEDKVWFLPKGRKDVGETLEQTALRETYEESGYRVNFLPLYTQSRAPQPGGKSNLLSRNTEPIYVTTASWKRGEYLSFYYVGQIPDDAVPEENTRMPDEQTYVTHLLSIEEAYERLRYSSEFTVVQYAWELWQLTIREDDARESGAQRQ